MPVWHGTDQKNIPLICKTGFRIPQKHDMQVVNGAAHGIGVYTGIGPNLSMDYARGANQLLICLTVPGKTSNN